jgi:hypothetical protein
MMVVRSPLRQAFYIAKPNKNTGEPGGVRHCAARDAKRSSARHT